MKTKSTFLLIIFMLSFIPVNTIQAEEKINRTFSNALDFLYLSDAILQNQVVDETSSAFRVLSPALPSPTLDMATELINQMINAAKAQRNDHFKKCNETVNLYREQGKTCEADKAEAYCKSRYQELTDKIASLRIVRGGDRRNRFTKAWHGLKRTGARIWHGIGPLGRKFLKEVGPEALKIVSTGGIGAEATFKHLIKHTFKKIGREELKKIALRGIQRLLKVQLDIATAAGIDICNQDEEIAEADNHDDQETLSSNEEEVELGVYEIRATFDEASSNMDWEGFLPGCYRHQAYGEGAFFQFEINLDEDTFQGTASGIGESEEGNWHGWGVYSVDGISGTVKENPSGSGYQLEGTGNVDLTYRLEAYCLDDMGGATVFTEDEKSLRGTATVSGNFFVMTDTWYLTINIIFIEGPARFSAGCYSCELFPWEP